MLNSKSRFYERYGFPFVLVGTNYSGKTFKALNLACELVQNHLNHASGAEKVLTFVTMTRLARQQALEKVEAKMETGILGFNFVTYYELIKQAKPRIDRISKSHFSDIEVLEGIKKHLQASSHAVVFDQADTIGEHIVPLVEIMPKDLAYGVCISMEQELIEKNRIIDSIRLSPGFEITNKRSDSTRIDVLPFEPFSDIVSKTLAWVNQKTDVPSPGVWRKIVVLDSYLGFQENQIKKELKKCFEEKGIRSWVSGVDKYRQPDAPEVCVVRRREAAGLDAQKILFIEGRKPQANDENFASKSFLVGENFDANFFTNKSVEALNQYDLLYDGRPVIATSICLHGSQDEWWVEILDSGGYFRVSPFKLQKGFVEWRNQSPDQTTNARSKLEYDQAFPPTNPIKKDQSFFFNEDHFSGLTADILNRFHVVKYEGFEVSVTATKIDGPISNWWVEIMYGLSYERVHPSKLKILKKVS